MAAAQRRLSTARSMDDKMQAMALSVTAFINSYAAGMQSDVENAHTHWWAISATAAATICNALNLCGPDLPAERAALVAFWGDNDKVKRAMATASQRAGSSSGGTQWGGGSAGGAPPHAGATNGVAAGAGKKTKHNKRQQEAGATQSAQPPPKTAKTTQDANKSN